MVEGRRRGVERRVWRGGGREGRGGGKEGVEGWWKGVEGWWEGGEGWWEAGQQHLACVGDVPSEFEQGECWLGYLR